MNKKILFTTLGIVFLISGALIYVVSMPNKGKIVDKITSVNESTESPPSTRPGAYVDYSKDAIATTKGTKLLFFHAPWCPQCRAIEESILTSGVPDGVTVFKVDYDSNQKLRQQYGVTIQTTFIKIDDQGNKVASYVAYEEPNFSAVARELLP